MRRRVWGVAGGALAAALLVPAAVAAGGTADGDGWAAGAAEATAGAALAWEACPDAAALECAELDVPLDHDAPDGATVTLALVRAPAAEPERRLGSLVVNRGGPGYSAVDYLRGVQDGTLPSPVSDAVLARYDLVGVDPRGSGRSQPAVECFASPEEAADFAAGVPSPPVNAAERAARAAADAEFAERCRARSGALLDHLSTVAIAHDLDLVRAALGEERLHYLGQSYGTYLGAVYANLFTDRVGRFVFDSVLDPAARDSGPPGSMPSSRTGSDVATAETLREFFRLCAEGDCAFGDGDPEAAFDRLADTLAAGPVQLRGPDGEPVELTYSYLLSWTGGWLYQPMFWNEVGGAPFLSAAEAALADPTGPEAARLAEEIALNEAAGAFGAPYPDISQAFHGVTCPEVDTVAHPAALAELAAEREELAPRFGTLRAYETSACVPWTAQGGERYEGPWDAETDAPVLILNSRFDPSTPVWGAERLHRTLPNSRLLINEGWGHVTTQQSTCAVDAASAYLLDGTLPEQGAHCEPDHVPFAAGATP